MSSRSPKNVSYKEDYRLSILNEGSSNSSYRTSSNNFLNKPTVTYNPIKYEKRTYFNRTVQEIIRTKISKNEDRIDIGLIDAIKIFVCKFIIEETKNSKTRRQIAEIKARKALKKLDYLKDEYEKNKRTAYTSFESKYSSELAVIPEL